LRRTAGFVRAHHERADGRGYPDGLLGSEIPYESRIIGVGDSFHAMTVSRPYSRVRTPAQALAELMNCSGTQFEPEWVDAFGKSDGIPRVACARPNILGTAIRESAAMRRAHVRSRPKLSLKKMLQPEMHCATAK
jgi:hypothetical protein